MNRINLVDTAKLIRQVLKQSFPGVKFSVRGDSYSMGASINISWKDGPSRKMVESVTSDFGMAGSMGMDDYVPRKHLTMDGVSVSFGCDYASCSREYSEEFKARAKSVFARLAASGYLRSSVKECEREYSRAESNFLAQYTEYLKPRRSAIYDSIQYNTEKNASLETDPMVSIEVNTHNAPTKSSPGAKPFLSLVSN